MPKNTTTDIAPTHTRIFTAIARQAEALADRRVAEGISPEDDRVAEPLALAEEIDHLLITAETTGEFLTVYDQAQSLGLV